MDTIVGVRDAGERCGEEGNLHVYRAVIVRSDALQLFNLPPSPGDTVSVARAAFGVSHFVPEEYACVLRFGCEDEGDFHITEGDAAGVAVADGETELVTEVRGLRTVLAVQDERCHEVAFEYVRGCCHRVLEQERFFGIEEADFCGQFDASFGVRCEGAAKFHCTFFAGTDGRDAPDGFG